MEQTIVVPIRGASQAGDDVSAETLSVASAWASRRGARLLLVSVVEAATDAAAVEPLRQAGSGADAVRGLVAARREYLAQLAATLPGVPVATEVRIGNPVSEVLRLLDHLDQPLLVMASHRRLGISRLVRGSVAFNILHAAPCPVVLVRRPMPAGRSLVSVVVGLDGSIFAETALERVVALLGGEDLRLHLVHIVNYLSGETPPETQQRMGRYLAGVAARLSERGIATEWDVRSGEPAAELIKTSQERGAGLIAMATHGRSGLDWLLLGSVAESVVDRSPVPVFLTRPDEAALARLATAGKIERARWLTVEEIMVRPVVTVRENTPLEEVARTMLTHRIGGVPVVDAQGRLVGIVTESDFTGKDRFVPFAAYRVPQLFGQWLPEEGVERIHATARTLPARAVMTSGVVTATEEEPLTAVVERMIHRDVNRLPVVRDGVPIGMVTRHDLLKLMRPDWETEIAIETNA